MADSFKTPRPVPVFYASSSTGYSTKRARRTTACRRIRPPSLTAPAAGRVFSWFSEKPNPISSKALPNGYLTGSYYDETNLESYFKQCFEVRSKLGEGSFGKVYKVKSKEDGRLYAVKKARETFRSEADRLHRLTEVHKHEALPKHPNLVKFVKAWEERGRLYIQTELCKTSLSNFAESTHEIPERLIWTYLVDLLLAVNHLHNNDLAHMDIKPENIFISEDGICKLGDFGLVVDLKRGKLEDSLEGDAKYLAPELLQGRVGKHADIFSLGITILELTCDLDLPCEGEVWQWLRQGRLPDNLLAAVSPELRKVIYLMMLPNEIERPSASQLLAMPEIAKVVRWRRLYIVYRKMVNAVKSISLLTWMLIAFFARNLVMQPCALFFRTLITGNSPSPRTPLPLHWSDDSSSVMNVTRRLNMDGTSSDGSNDDYVHDISTINDDAIADLPDITNRGLGDSSPDLNFNNSYMKEIPAASPIAQRKTTAARFRPWNSTPANEQRIRRRVVDIKPPNDLKRLRGIRGNGFNYTSSPVNGICNSWNDSLIGSPLGIPDIDSPKLLKMNLSIDRSTIPPRNLMNAFSEDNQPSSDESI